MEKFTILVDLDEVLVNFRSAAMDAHGIDTLEEMDRLFEKDVKGWWTGDDFYAPIHGAKEEFWLGLGFFDHAHVLLKHVKKITDDWHFVSSPTRDPTSYSGKAMFIRKWFRSRVERLTITCHKDLLAAPDVILIDDSEENIEAFKKRGRGGHPILFPSSYNSRSEFVSNPYFGCVGPELTRITGVPLCT